jgi:hypothetical protein
VSVCIERICIELPPASSPGAKERLRGIVYSKAGNSILFVLCISCVVLKVLWARLSRGGLVLFRAIPAALEERGILFIVMEEERALREVLGGMGELAMCGVKDAAEFIEKFRLFRLPVDRKGDMFDAAKLSPSVGRAAADSMCPWAAPRICFIALELHNIQHTTYTTEERDAGSERGESDASERGERDERGKGGDRFWTRKRHQGGVEALLERSRVDQVKRLL